MKKIIILAGNGLLPINIINILVEKKIHFYSLIISDYGWDENIEKFNHKCVNIGKVLTEIIKLKKLGFNSIIMAGSIPRPGITNIKPDLKSLRILPSFTKVLLRGGDNLLLKFIIKELEKLKLIVLNIKSIAPELFLGLGKHTKVYPSKISQSDIDRGRSILNTLSNYDIGQSIIVQQGTVIGIEAIEGTDNLIKRSKKYFKDGVKPTLIKLFKKKQDIRADLPTIGSKTIQLCKSHSIGGIAFTGNKTLFIDSQKVIKDMDVNNLFLIGING
tara:strand:+ start:2557 stop:3375 length:819 start_codon:yes stop_codon:yes gene_type:complete